METMKEVVEGYLESWNQTDAGARRARIDRLFAEGCRYTDPSVTVAGRDAIDRFIGAMQKRFRGVSFVLAGGVDAHHAVARFTWHAMAPGVAEPVAIGFDVIETEGGHITQVLGFLDKVPG